MFRCTLGSVRSEGMPPTQVYSLEVVTSLPEYGGEPGVTKTYKLEKRYSEFEALHAALASAGAAGRGIPSLPGKSLFSMFGSESVVAERTDAFTALLAFVAQEPTLRVHPATGAFVGCSPFPARRPGPPKAAAAAAPPASAPASRSPSAAAAPPAPAVWKDNPLEEALSSLSTEEAVASRKQPPPAASPPPKPKAATPGPAKPSSFARFGAEGAAGAVKAYDRSGEGLWDAIKDGATKPALELLEQGVDPSYVGSQGMSLLHVAALFNRSDIALALAAAGADPLAKNGQGETVLDCAPASLAHKLRAAAGGV